MFIVFLHYLTKISSSWGILFNIFKFILASLKRVWRDIFIQQAIWGSSYMNIIENVIGHINKDAEKKKTIRKQETDEATMETNTKAI